MVRQKIEFPGGDGQTLAAILDSPDSQPKAFALFAHCFTCSKNLKAVSNIAGSLNDSGIAVLRFDFTGLGESEGDFSDTNFSSNVSDLVAAASYLEKQHQGPSILIGHSLGGTAVLQAVPFVSDDMHLTTRSSGPRWFGGFKAARSSSGA